MLGDTHAAIRFERSAPPALLVRELEALAAETRSALERRKKLLWRGLGGLAYSVLGGVVVFFVLIVAMAWLGSLLDESSPGSEWGGLLALLGAALGVLHALLAFVISVWILVRRSKISDAVLDPEKLACATSLLRTVAPDAEPNAPTRLFIDFSRVDLGRALQLPSGASAHMQRWLHLSAPLSSKVTLRVDVTTRHKTKERRKRKYTKRKESWQDVVDLRLSFRGGGLPQDAEHRIQPRFAYSFPRLMRCRTTPRAILLRFATAPTLSLRGRQRLDQGLEQRLDARKIRNLVLRAFRATVAAKKSAAKPPPAAPAPRGGGTQLMPQVPG